MKDFLKVAKQAALEAGEIISKYFGKKHHYKFKNDDKSNFATQADLKAEQKIVQILTQNFPKHSIIAEESGKNIKDSEYTWVIDPLDGTFTFILGLPYFSVSIGLLKKGKPILGVVYHVTSEDLYWAMRGKGAFLNGKRIRVSSIKNLIGAGMAFDFGHQQRRSDKFDLYVKPLFPEVGYIYSLGSSVTIMALVGKSIFDGFVAQAWIWDFAAGAVIVREAGGKVTDFEGKEPDWSKERLNIVASNGLIHDQILEALKR